MHELQIAGEVIKIARAEMKRRRLTRISEIGLAVGALAAVDPDALAFSFEASVVDTPLAGSRLHIDFIPVEGTCRNCRRDFKVSDYVFICPHCGSGDILVRRGEELDVTYILA
nr:hydrogenase maturation nickel metallochaperone HypA [candidate division Zixibacteria bacterium]